MAVSSTVTEQVLLGSHLDVRNVGVVRTMIDQILETATGDVVIDMRALDVIDAAGLGMLTAAHLRAERAGRHLLLRHCGNDVRRVLAVTGLNRVLHLDRGHLDLTA
ncbi:MAG: STAS domain-containing protein [Propionibacteriales bacterium]|nr:STAS domain-containing protein [Propionibacteriales bacterium]